jgi:hypothetical protein
VKFAKKVNHCLFVEEETYDWAPVRSGSGRGLLIAMALIMLGAVLLLSQLR